MSETWGTVYQMERDKALGNDADSLRAEIARLRIDRAMLIDAITDDALTPVAKNVVAIAIRDGGLMPTEETIEWAKRCHARRARS